MMKLVRSFKMQPMLTSLRKTAFAGVFSQSRHVQTAAHLVKNPVAEVYDHGGCRYNLFGVEFDYPARAADVADWGANSNVKDIEEIFKSEPPAFKIPLIGTRPSANKVMNIVNTAFKSAGVAVESSGNTSPWTTAYPPDWSVMWPNPYVTNGRNQRIAAGGARMSNLWEVSSSAGVSIERLEEVYAEFIEEGHRRSVNFDRNGALLMEIILVAAKAHVTKSRTAYFESHGLLQEVMERPADQREALLTPPITVDNLAAAMHRTARAAYIGRYFGPGQLTALMQAHASAMVLVRETNERAIAANVPEATVSGFGADASSAVLPVREQLDAVLKAMLQPEEEVEEVDPTLKERGVWDFRACLKQGARGPKPALEEGQSKPEGFGITPSDFDNGDEFAGLNGEVVPKGRTKRRLRYRQ